MPAEKAAETPAKPTTGFSMPAFKPPTAADASNSGLKSSIFASQATKPTFSSFVPPAGSAPAAPAPKNDEVESMDEDRDEEYYKNIRGLNVSIQKKINDAVSVNAFVNLAPLLEQYKKHWDAINKPAAGVPESDTKMVSPVKPTAPATFGAKPEEAKPEEAKPEEAKKSEEKPVPAFGIAAASKESADSSQPKFGFKAAVTSPAKPSSGFSFSFTKPSPASAAPADDKPKFSFGFSKPGESAPAAQDKPKFSFGGIGPSAASKPDESQNADDDAANDDEENVDEPPKKPTTAGEEGEITETETRSKLYKWDAEAKAYKDLGIGIFKVKSWTADGAKRARLLCRQVGSDKLTLNVSVFREMVTDHQDGKKEVVVMVIVDGKPVRYLVRVKTPEMAKALYDVIERVKGEL
ncbi:hypothetical protein EC988_005247 [Linderina pennispora]|nr:hypothetical protein EC988_005247 [Linderina pennispora]